MTPLVFWQNIPSIHQAPLLRAVAEKWPGEVLVVTENDISHQRLNQGWSFPDFGLAKLITSPTRTERLHLIKKLGIANSVHIFSGLHAYPMTYWTLGRVCATDATVGVFLEPGRHNDGLLSYLRRLRYVFNALNWNRRLEFILVAGELGVKWYSSCFFNKSNIIPFGYFVEAAEKAYIVENKFIDCCGDNTYKLIYVGQLCDRKGVDLLLKALKFEGINHWRLDIVGDGPCKSKYVKIVNQLGIVDRVRWLGTLSNNDVKERMSQADVLVLPSRFDGWGAVVNEALMAGTSVIVSDSCGASDLVREPWRGRVFQSGSVRSLQNAIVTDMAPLTFTERNRIQNWAQSAISPKIAADYLLNIIESVQRGSIRPSAPWR